MPKQEKGKVCFVIAPIGEEGSEARRRSDQVLKHIITPAAKECGYETVRADKISEPGIITAQVIQHLVEDALVIADLTGRNPNVFYELAVRHAVRKACVQLIQIGEPIPFDVAQSRTIQLDHHDLDSVARCRDELIKHIQSVEKDPTDVDTPISVAIDMQSLRQSSNPLEKSSAEIISMLQDLRAKVSELGEREGIRPRLPSSAIEELVMFTDRLAQILELAKGEKLGPERLEEARFFLHRIERIVYTLARESGSSPDMLERFAERRMIIRRKKPEVE